MKSKSIILESLIVLNILGCTQHSSNTTPDSHKQDSIISNTQSATNGLNDKEKKLLGLWTNDNGSITQKLVGYVMYNNNHSANAIVLSGAKKIRYNEYWEITEQDELYEKITKLIDTDLISELFIKSLPQQTSFKIISLSSRVLIIENGVKLFKVDDDSKNKDFLSTFSSSVSERNLAQANNRHNNIQQEFNKHSKQIEGAGRECWIVDTLIGDLNGDGVDDAVVYYGCGIKGNVGNASAGDGIAILLSENGKLQFIGTDENYVDFVPDSILAGTIYGEILTYADADARCCPSIKTKMKLKLVNNKLVKIN